MKLKLIFFFLVFYTFNLTAQTEDEWAHGIENQRKADLGNGYYLNPIVPGDHPDPSILKDGNDYYMTFSSFDNYPGLIIWHSRDLVNWEPLFPTLFKNVGSVWAPDLVKYKNRYYIYFPGRTDNYRSIYVIYADSINGHWSDPIDLKNQQIDPGHIVGEDGKRYLFLSGGNRVQLSDDGFSIVGDMKHVYDGWKYPEDWVVESFSQEGPKMMRHGHYFYMVLAEGGTAGPPTGHMVVCARAKSVNGPWENSPYNPIIRTKSAKEHWWSRGHATLVECNNKWYIVYHAYENGYYTLGRQTLLEPVEWTKDGWFKSAGYDPAKPIPMPVKNRAVPNGMAFSDNFSHNKFGIQWNFYKGGKEDNQRVRYSNNTLIIKAKGSSPADCSPLSFVVGDHSYQAEIEMEIDSTAQAGMLLFYNKRLYAGLGFNSKNFILHRYGMERLLPKPESVKNRLFMRIKNDKQILTIYYSIDATNWVKFGVQMEVSCYNHNAAYDFLSLRPAIYAAGKGEVRFKNFIYRAF